jgi:hypothetical protein
VPVAIRLCLLGCGLTAAFSLAACGGGGGTGTASERPPSQAETQAVSPLAGKRCQGQVGGFLASMDSLRRRLAVGLAYEQYVHEVESVRAAYKRIRADELAIECLTKVGTPSEVGFNEYIDAANTWGECVGETGCESATVEPALQRKWRVASRFLAEAHGGLRDLGSG